VARVQRLFTFSSIHSLSIHHVIKINLDAVCESDGECFTVKDIKYCVLQSSAGPFLFISSIDDVSVVIHFCRFHIYTDDLQMYHSSSVADLQRCYDLKRI
jgi:hypothetical protein